MTRLRDGLRILGVACTLAATPVAAQVPAPLEVVAVIPRSVVHIAFAHDALWGVGDGRLVRVDPATDTVTDIALPPAPEGVSLMDAERYRGLAVGEGAVWVPDLAASAIYRVDAAGKAVTLTIPTDIFGSAGSIGVGEGSVWVLGFADRNRTLLRYDAGTGEEIARIALPAAGIGVLAAHGWVWVSAEHDAEIYRIDPAKNAVAGTAALGASSTLLAASDGAVWVWRDIDGTLQRIDPATGTVTATIDTGTSDPESDGDVAAGGGFIWTVNRAGTVVRVDPEAATVAGTFKLPTGALPGRRLRYGAGSLWMSGAEIRRIAPPPTE